MDHSFNQSWLSADDLPPERLTLVDRLLRLRLEERTGYYFYQRCDRSSQILLADCAWSIKVNPDALTLLIPCASLESYWQIVGILKSLGVPLEWFSASAKIIVFPPVGRGEPLHVWVDEMIG